MQQWVLYLAFGATILFYGEQICSTAEAAFMALHSLFAAILFGGAEKVELPSNIFDKEFLQTLTCGEWKEILGSRSFIRSQSGGVYHFHSHGMTWFKADSYCRNLGMHLAIFETKEEMDAVHDVNPSKGEWGSFYWVAASSLGHGIKQFFWEDEMAVADELWARGVPSEKTQACVAISSHQGKLSDDSCGKLYRTLCELSSAYVHCFFKE